MTIEYYLKSATKTQLSEGKCPIFARIRVRTRENTFDIRLSTGLFTYLFKDASEWRETMSNTKRRNRYASTEEGHAIIPILDEISEKILKGEIQNGQKIKVDFSDENLTFETII